jgi:hypothetical protein
MPARDSQAPAVTAIKSLLLTSTMLALQIAIFFVAADGVIGLRPVAFFAASFLHYAVSMIAQYRLNPSFLPIDSK